MPTFHVVVGSDGLEVNTPECGGPGGTCNPGTFNVLGQLLKGSSSCFPFQLSESGRNLVLWKEGKGHNLSDPGMCALISAVRGLKAKFLNLKRENNRKNPTCTT